MTPAVSAPDLGQAAEQTVVALACTGDGAAFTEIVRRYQSRVRNFMYRLCRHAAERDDLAQQVFLKAWLSLDQLRSPGAFGGWLQRIMVTTWLEEIRRKRIAFTTEPELGELAELGENRDSVADGMDLDAALAQLPAPMRLCVVLAYHEQMAHSEISAVTELPLGTVKSNIARGSSRLRELLAAYRA